MKFGRRDRYWREDAATWHKMTVEETRPSVHVGWAKAADHEELSWKTGMTTFLWNYFRSAFDILATLTLVSPSPPLSLFLFLFFHRTGIFYIFGIHILLIKAKDSFYFLAYGVLFFLICLFICWSLRRINFYGHKTREKWYLTIFEMQLIL